ncbi:MAG TPA: helix-turn-helix transcriptional regulator [Solirubrobacterales bacterium]|nr:helix-turn-helix transcriptional regulator [Solirubrobacterales bacterium]
MMVRTPPQLSPAPTLGERFGLNLWRSRRRADLSQERLADLVGMHRTEIGALERGLRLPRIDTIAMLAAGTNVSVCVLLEGMEWRPGRYVDGDFYIEHPAARLRGGSVRS